MSLQSTSLSDRISIDHLDHWKTVVDGKIKGHEAEANRQHKKAILYGVASAVAAVAYYALAILLAVTTNIPCWAIVLPVGLTCLPPFAYFMCKSMIEENNSQKTNNRVKILQDNRTILNSKEEFDPFVTKYKVQGVAPRLTEEQFIQALDLYGEQKRFLATAESTRVCFEQKVESLKLGFAL
jgi:hypothetical protein